MLLPPGFPVKEVSNLMYRPIRLKIMLFSPLTGLLCKHRVKIRVCLLTGSQIVAIIGTIFTKGKFLIMNSTSRRFFVYFYFYGSNSQDAVGGA